MYSAETIADHIVHKGIITSVSSAARSVRVSVSNDDECGGCPAAALCGISGKDSGQEITVSVADAAKYSVGQRVEVVGTEMMHRKAIMLATVIPCIAMVAIMTLIYLLTLNQLYAAFGGVLSMVVFFIAIYLLRNRITHEFNFTIRPERG